MEVGRGSEKREGRNRKKNPTFFFFTLQKKIEKTKQNSPVFRSPEVCRVYVGSLNADKPPRTDVNPTGAPLFKAEAEDLMSDLVRSSGFVLLPIFPPFFLR